MDPVSGSCITYFSCCCASSLDAFKGLLLRLLMLFQEFSWCNCGITCCLLCWTKESSVLWFLRSFLRMFLFSSFVSNCVENRKWCGWCWQKQNVEDSEFAELNALVGFEAWLKTVYAYMCIGSIHAVFLHTWYSRHSWLKTVYHFTTQRVEPTCCQARKLQNSVNFKNSYLPRKNTSKSRTHTHHRRSDRWPTEAIYSTNLSTKNQRTDTN